MVHCGHVHALNGNLDVPLMNVIRADPETAAHSGEAAFPAWAGPIADEIDPVA
jgi:hypothetical protein